MPIIKFVNSGYSDILCATSASDTGISLTDTNTKQDISGKFTPGTNIFAWLKANDRTEYNTILSFLTTNLSAGYQYHYTPQYVISGGTNQSTLQFTFAARQTNNGIYQIMVGYSLVSGEYTGYNTFTRPTHELVLQSWPTLQNYIDAIENEDIGFYIWAYPGAQTDTDTVGIICYFPENMSTYRPTPYLTICMYTPDLNLNKTIVQSVFSPIPVTPDYGPDSEPDGGWGDFSDNTDTIELPGVPTISALDTGMVRMYNPTAGELQQLSHFIWTPDFFTNVIKNFSDPMQAIVSLSISPVAPNVSSTPSNIVVGNIPAFLDIEGTITPITAKPLTSQYATINCGSITLNEYWGSALDYSPYSKCEIYLPYIGVQSLSIDDVMGSTLTLQYNIDLLTGICTAVLKCEKSQHMDFDAALYHWSGNMISNLPISGSNFAQVITALTSSIVSAGIPIVTGAGGAAIASGVVGGVMNMMNAKAQVQKSGSISMQSGSLDNQTPYLILTRPIQSKAAAFQSYKGWPSNITASLGSLTGYTEVEYIHILNIGSATDEEKAEIERLLKEGVVI